jgi:hypothetical protein
MSNDNPFSKQNFGIDPEVYCPLLKEDLTTIPPPFTVEHLLDETDFANTKLDDDYVWELNYITNILETGFLNPMADLTRTQWLRSVAQILAAVLHGFGSFHPGDDYPNILANLDPEGEDGVVHIRKALGALFKYFQTPRKGPQHWQQCSRCLQVSGNLVSSQELEAVLLTCNQHVATARTHLLNTKLAEYHQ